MNADVLSRARPGDRIACVDLVETSGRESSAALLSAITGSAAAAGGNVVFANQAVAPMIVPDEKESDEGLGLFVLSQYPSREAARVALANRSEEYPEFSGGQVRTYAGVPVSRIELFIGRTLPRTLGLMRREYVRTVNEGEGLTALIRSALVLGEQPDEARWTRLVQRAGSRPIWMLNMLEYVNTAVYGDDAADVAPDEPISGARAYRLYGSGMISSLAAVGGRVGWSGRVLGQLAGPDEGTWHQVAIAVYPSAAAMLTMLALPKYRAAHVHRAAALARTRLLATQPVASY